jgi:predicted transport protein
LQPKDVYEAIGKLQIVNITLDRNVDDAQAIFESLNSTGKELSESDLIRNYVLMGLEPSEQRYVYEHMWRPMELLFDYEKQDSVMDRFFRDYLTMKTKRIPKIDRVYEGFKAYHLNCEFSTIRELCADLLTYATYYTNMVFRRSDKPVLKSLYSDIGDLRMEVAFPFLLKVHNDCTEGVITEDDLIEIIKMCISYVFRRSICDIPTNSLNKTFATLRNEIKTDDYMNSIKAFFVLRDDYKEFPDDEKFEKAFVSRDIYNMRSRNFILSHLENFGNKAPIIIENYTIEHIMPQNSNPRDEWKTMLGENWKEVQKTYLHTIGNLTLTAYNSEMSDNPFMVKMDMEGGFKESALRLNAYLVKLTEWNEQHIKERAKLLAEKAEQIWAYPEITDVELAPYQVEEKPAQKYTIDTYDINAFTRTLFDMIDRRICNLSPDVKREFKKLYIAYKLDTNFVDIVVQKQRLRISLNMKFSEIYDPKGICRDITGLGRWGNGDVEVFFEHTSEIDDVMELIEQSYNKQAEE